MAHLNTLNKKVLNMRDTIQTSYFKYIFHSSGNTLYYNSSVYHDNYLTICVHSLLNK